MKNKVYITNYWYARNYGACLTAFALHELVNELNYKPCFINNMPIYEKIQYPKIFNKKFIEKYCNTTKLCRNYSDFASLNLDSEIFITGSDQIFNPNLARNRINDYLLNFVDINAKKIAFSASFGANKEYFLKENSKDTIEKFKIALKSFDKVSVREESGLEICKEVLGVEAEWIIDPVFIVDPNAYYNLIKESKIDTKDKIVSYVMEPELDEFKKAYNYLSTKFNAEVFNLDGFKYSCEDWINAIKNCKLFVTDSFHGTCFAIMFNKPFILISNKGSRNTRFDSIFKLFNIENKCIKNITEIFHKDCIFTPNYENVNVIIDKERMKGRKFLENALSSPIINFDEKKDAKIHYLNSLVKDYGNNSTIVKILRKTIWNYWLNIYHRSPIIIKYFINFFRGKL